MATTTPTPPASKPSAPATPPPGPAAKNPTAASMDFVGAYPYTNIGRPGHNRNPEDPIEPAKWAEPQPYWGVAEDQRDRSDREVQQRVDEAKGKAA